MYRSPTVLLLLGVLVAAGCADLDSVRRENNALKAKVAQLESELFELHAKGDTAVASRIRSFTVGLAASKPDFDEQAFLDLLNLSLKKNAVNTEYSVARETDERVVTKVRGMLLHQYLAEERIPITITNLSYKQRSAKNDLLIGEQVVPRSAAGVSGDPDGSTVHITFKGPLEATMRRDIQGRYSVAYEERNVGGGRINIPIRDVEILDANERPRSVRQGDLAFNWRLNLEKLQVYVVKNYQGDIGAFLRTMRYPGVKSAVSRYQALRDHVFLFGYRSYQTGLVNQLQTPAYITRVEVLAVPEEIFAKLEGGASEEDILRLIGNAGQWVPCTFVEYDNGRKVWERPRDVTFPFVSRQYWAEKNLVFYNKYDTEGQILLGTFEKTES